jgi:hypothetical protein
MVIFGNVLDHRTYEIAPEGTLKLLESKDLNAIPFQERLEMVYARGASWEILQWIFHEYIVFNRVNGKGLDGLKDLALPYLSEQAYAIVWFKKKALESEIEPEEEPAITEEQVKREVVRCLQNFTDVQFPPDTPTAGSLRFRDSHKYAVRKRLESEIAEPFKGKYPA